MRVLSRLFEGIRAAGPRFLRQAISGDTCISQDRALRLETQWVRCSGVEAPGSHSIIGTLLIVASVSFCASASSAA